jgi:hypothetical protein
VSSIWNLFDSWATKVYNKLAYRIKSILLMKSVDYAAGNG